MEILRYNQSDFAEAVTTASVASSLFDVVIEERVRAIIRDVQARDGAAAQRCLVSMGEQGWQPAVCTVRCGT